MFAGLTPRDPIIDELVSGYAICPYDCEILEPFKLRTSKELAEFRRCPNCGHNLDTIMLHVVTTM